MKITEEIITELGFKLVNEEPAVKHYNILIHDISIVLEYVYLEGWVSIYAPHRCPYIGRRIHTVSDMVLELYRLIHFSSVENSQRTIRNVLGIK
jgi:hypothetical protein